MRAVNWYSAVASVSLPPESAAMTISLIQFILTSARNFTLAMRVKLNLAHVQSKKKNN